MLGRLLEKRQVRKRGLGDVAERPEREKHRHKENRLGRRHVVAEIDDRTVVLLAGVKPLNDHVEPEFLRGRDGREAGAGPLLRGEKSKRLCQRTVGQWLLL